MRSLLVAPAESFASGTKRVAFATRAIIGYPIDFA